MILTFESEIFKFIIKIEMKLIRKIINLFAFGFIHQ